MASRDRDQLELTVTRHDRRSESRRLMDLIRVDADRICARFGLRYKHIRAERPEVNEHYGVCYADGEIRIRLRHAVTGKPLRYSSLMDTLCHELAHTRHFNHGEGFQALLEAMIDWCRAEGIYQPAAVARRGDQQQQGQDAGQTQLPLFGDPRLREILARKK